MLICTIPQFLFIFETKEKPIVLIPSHKKSAKNGW